MATIRSKQGSPPSLGVAFVLALASIGCFALSAAVLLNALSVQSSLPEWPWQVPLNGFPAMIFFGCLHWVSIQSSSSFDKLRRKAWILLLVNIFFPVSLQ